jgi:predicted DCC family thiol-disulfide oxidoreductase YuxK
LVNESDHQNQARPVIIYDGDCAFCRRSIALIQRRDRDNHFEYLPRQEPGLEGRFPQIAEGDFDTGMRLIEPDQTVHVGADAIYRIARKLPYYRRWAWMYKVPVIRGVTRRVYAWVAKNRLKLSKVCDDGEACAVAASDGQPTSPQRN